MQPLCSCSNRKLGITSQQTYQKTYFSKLLTHSVVGYYLGQSQVLFDMHSLLLQVSEVMNMLLPTWNNPWFSSKLKVKHGDCFSVMKTVLRFLWGTTPSIRTTHCIKWLIWYFKIYINMYIHTYIYIINQNIGYWYQAECLMLFAAEWVILNQ